MIYGWILLGLAALGGAIFLYAITKQRGLAEHDRAKIKAAWENLELLAQGDNESEWVKAIFEADKLLDYALKQRRVAGNNLGERLKNAKAIFHNVDAAWQGHKLRNELAHNLDSQLTRPQVERAMNNFKNALRQLGGL